MSATRTAASMFSFPDAVDEVSARLVAAGVVALALTAIVSDLRWLTAFLAYGFVARVAAGPRFSPLALLVTRGIRPKLSIEPRLVSGPPKRFAQGLGAVGSVTAAVMALGFGAWGPAQLVLAILAGAALLEAAFGFCIGCTLFAALMRGGLVPRSVCEECGDIWGTLA